MRLKRLAITSGMLLITVACGQKGALLLTDPSKPDIIPAPPVKAQTVKPAPQVPVKQKSKE